MFLKIQNLCFVLLSLILTSNLAFAYSTGITGRTQTGCTCHSSSPSSSTTLSAQSTSGNFRTRPGQTLNISITVANSIMQAAGIDIAVHNQNGQNAGTLTPGTNSGLQASGGELTHNTPKTMNNGQATFNFFWTAPNTGGEYTLRSAGNAVNNNGSNSGDAWNYLSAVTISVADITVSAPNGGENWCLGSSRNITWTSALVQNVRISLSSDGGQTWTTLADNVSAQLGSWTWNIPNNMQAGSQYKIKIADASDTTFYDESNGTFSLTSPPQISQQPSPAILCEGQTIFLAVTAQGLGLSFQWRRNGTPIPGATQASYSTTATLSASGLYDCIVSNSCGSATSDTARITVNELPKISQHPESSQVCVGQSVSFSVVATGTGIQYQWRKNGNPIPGANSSTYTIASVQLSDSGNYDVVVSGTCSPAAQSQSAKLSVNEPPSITQQPRPATVRVGSSVTFSITAKGSAPLAYQWRKNGNRIAGANQPTYTITSVQISDAGYYDCIVSNSCDSVTSQIVQLLVTPLGQPVLTLQDTLVDVGQLEVNDTLFSLFSGFIRNTGEDTLRITNIGITGEDAQNFEIDAGDLPILLAPQQDHSLLIVFTPSKPGVHTALVSFTSNASNSPTLKLMGNGVLPVLSVDIEDVSFDTIDVGSSNEKSFIVRNPGPLSVTLQNVNISDENFRILQPNNFPIQLDSGESITFTIEFTPTEAKTYSAILSIAYSGKYNNETLRISLSGVGNLPSFVNDNIVQKDITIEPNPAYGEATFRFTQSEKPLQIEIVSLDGRIIRRFANLGSDISSLTWDGTNNTGEQIPSGIYLVRIYWKKSIANIPLIFIR